MPSKSAPADDDGAASKRMFDSDLANQVRASAQQIWLAGMGAFARAQAEGTKMFEGLVKEGASLQGKAGGSAGTSTGANADEKFTEMASRVSEMAGDWQAKAGQQWDKLEGAFQDRTAKALKRLGVPSAADLELLMLRLQALETQLAAMTAIHAAAPPSARSTAPTAKGALKKSAAAAGAKRATTATKAAKRSTLKRATSRKTSSG